MCVSNAPCREGPACEVSMSFPRKQTMTPLSVAARRRNALRSTGPRTPRAMAVAALNSLKHGLRARSFRQTLQNAGPPTAALDRLLHVLVSVLKPRNRFELQRVARYVQMLWGIRQRWGQHQRERRRKDKTGFSLRLSKPERAHQIRIM